MLAAGVLLDCFRESFVLWVGSNSPRYKIQGQCQGDIRGGATRCQDNNKIGEQGTLLSALGFTENSLTSKF